MYHMNNNDNQYYMNNNQSFNNEPPRGRRGEGRDYGHRGKKGGGSKHGGGNKKGGGKNHGGGKVQNFKKFFDNHSKKSFKYEESNYKRFKGMCTDDNWGENRRERSQLNYNDNLSTTSEPPQDYNSSKKEDIAMPVHESTTNNSTNTGNNFLDDNVQMPRKSQNNETINKDLNSANKVIETVNIKSENKIVDEDVVCLGKVVKEYCIEDEDEDEGNNKNKNTEIDSDSQPEEETTEPIEVTTNTSDTCLICDETDHTSFQCQMICKNCGGLYHNLKSCPKPPNLSTMMQYFMEFCMHQMGRFNPELGYTSTMYAATANQTPSASEKKRKRKNSLSKHKVKAKKSKKKIIKMEKESDKNTEDSSSSSSSSEETTENSDSSVTKNTKKQQKNKQRESAVNLSKTSEYSNNPFTTHASLPLPLPGFGSAAASPFNPQLFTQMLLSAFPGQTPLNFYK